MIALTVINKVNDLTVSQHPYVKYKFISKRRCLRHRRGSFINSLMELYLARFVFIIPGPRVFSKDDDTHRYVMVLSLGLLAVKIKDSFVLWLAKWLSVNSEYRYTR